MGEEEEEEGKKKTSTMRVVDQRLRGSGAVGGWVARGTIFQPNFHSDYFPKSKILFHARRILSP